MEANELTLVANYAPHLRLAPGPGAGSAAAGDARPGRAAVPRNNATAESGEAERLSAALPSPAPAPAPVAWGRTGLDEPPPAPPTGGR
jgi:hypothetical protein